MSPDSIAAIIFVIALVFFLWRKRKKVELQRALFPILYVVMYRSSFGLKTMDKIAKKWPRLTRVLGDIGTILGFIGMILICAQMIYATFQLGVTEEAAGVQLVLPIEAKGVFFVPFIYWIISIFLLALVHEFSHGILARAHNIKVKSSGFAFICAILPIIPAAFVEPEEKVLRKKSYRKQLSVFAAGPFSNMLFALVAIGIFLAMSPALQAAYDPVGMELTGLRENGPMFNAGVQEGEIITSFDGVEIISSTNITELLKGYSPGEELVVETENRTATVTLGEHPDNSSLAFLGIHTKPKLEKNEEFMATYGTFMPGVLQWIGGLLFWLFMLNLGIGLFNLLPLGPVDGGRMFQLVCYKVFKNKKTAHAVWKYVGMFFLAIILVNIFWGFF